MAELPIVLNPFLTAIAAGLTGLGLSVAIERFLVPQPRWRRSWRAWCIHLGVWLAAYVPLLLLLGRPWFAAAAVSALLVLLVAVNNAKMKALREPFVFPDYEYFTDAIRHPRLYIPFLGWGKFAVSVAGFLVAIAVGFGLEPASTERFSLFGQAGAAGTLLLVAIAALLAGCRQRRLSVGADASDDLQSLGLLASLWRYSEETRQLPQLRPALPFLRHASGAELPHLVAVQSESFFDPRPLFPGIRYDVLAEFDRLREESLLHGELTVPAWGANTVRTEFSFLTAIDNAALGVHRFNPYQAIVSGWKVHSVATLLKRLGYRTICVHPYPSTFYQRNLVFPQLGFDEFVDITQFDGKRRCGPYVSDAVVAEFVLNLVELSHDPVFVFAITMENHGPLHLEQVAAGDVDDLYVAPPPQGCEDMTIYLRHLRNADRMAGVLRNGLQKCDRRADLCWYGDHVPIMPDVYETLAEPKGNTEFVIWSSDSRCERRQVRLESHQLAYCWLQSVGVIDGGAETK